MAGIIIRQGENTLQAAASALTAEAWAEGTLPGGAGTKSAKEHATAAAASAASIASITEDVKVGLGLGASAVRMLEASGSITPSCYRAFTPTIGVQYEFVVVARAQGTRNFIQLINVADGVKISLTADLDAGTVAAGAPNSATGAIRDLGGGFFEFKATITPTAATSGNWQVRPSPDGTFPFTGSTSEGVWIKSIELREAGTTVNLFPSSDPADASFTKVSLTPTDGTVPEDRTSERVAALEALVGGVDLTVMDERVTDIETFINGSLTMDKLIEASGTVTPSLYRSVSFTSGSTYQFTYEVKAGERDRINIYNNGGGFINATFDLGAGTVEIVSSATTATITPLNSGCYRLVVTKVASATGSGNQQLRIYPEVGGQPYTGDGSSGVFLNSAEMSVNGAANSWTYPTDFTNAAWIKQNMTVSADAGVWLGLPVITGSDAPVAHPLNGLKVSMVGTSLVAQNIMPPAFAAETGATVQVLGSSGGALGLDARASPHYGSGAVTALFPSIAADADVIFLDMLVNDVAASDVPLGVVTDTTTATYCGALANFFSWCETNRPNAAVVVVVQTSAAATFTPSDYRHGVANANGNYLEDFQNATRRMCDYYGRPYIDPNRFGIGFLDMGSDSSDGLHWDASGAARIAKIYAGATRELADYGWLD